MAPRNRLTKKRIKELEREALENREYPAFQEKEEPDPWIMHDEKEDPVKAWKRGVKSQTSGNYYRL